MPLATQVAAPDDAPTPQPVRRVVVIVGRLLDVKTGRVLVDQAIAIEGERIAGIVPKAQAKTEGAQIIDAAERHRAPG